MMHYNLRVEQWIPVPLERTFAFFADPHNLPRITPPELDLRIDRLKIVTPDESHLGFAGIGSEVTVSFRVPLLSFRMQHVAHITGFEINRSFRDQHSRLPLMDWDHRHEFESSMRDGVAGAIVRDDLRYALGPWILGTVPNAFVVRRQLQKMFAFRHYALDQLVAAGSL
jgi:ligand-binding SRPBCC domain-containing protein